MPCRIFRPCGHSHSWHSGLGNLRLDKWKQRNMMSEWGFRPFPLTAADCHGYLANCVYMSPFAMTCGEFSYLTPPAQVCRLGLPLKQFSFVPHSYRFILPFSSGMIAFQLTTLPACCTPHQVSPPDKLADDRRFVHLPFWITFSYRRAIGGISIYPCALAYADALPDALNSLKNRP